MSDDRQLFAVTGGGNGKLDLAGELDAETAPVLAEALASRNGSALTLDLSGLTFIDSSGIHAIIAHLASGRPDAPLTLTGVSPHVLRVFEITCLDEHPNLRIDGGS